MANTAHIPRPSRFQLALALAVVKSQPSDHISKLRDHLKPGNQEQSHGSHEQYFDAVSYWQNQYKDSQREIDHLQSSLASTEQQRLRLEAEVERLKRDTATASLSMTTTSEHARETKRRKPPTKINGPLPHKKIKTEEELSLGLSPSSPIVIEELEHHGKDVERGPMIVHHLHNAHKLFRNTKPDAQAVTYHLVRILHLVTDNTISVAVRLQNELLKAVMDSNQPSRQQDTASVLSRLGTEFKDVQRAAIRSISAAYHGLTTLWSTATEPSRKHHGVLTYETVHALERLLQTLEELCQIQQRTRLASLDSAGLAAKNVKRKRAVKAPIIQDYTSLIGALIVSLDTRADGPHAAAFEGILYLLLERTAQKLFLLTFKHPPTQSIHEEIALGDITKLELEADTQNAIKIECQFLHQLVERAISLAASFFGSGINRPSSAAKGLKRTSTQRGNLSTVARQKLQHTLVRCMFGDFPRNTNEENITGGQISSVNHEFVDVLRKPVQLGPVPAKPKVEDVDVPTWFREEMWKLIGWDILKSDDGW